MLPSFSKIKPVVSPMSPPAHCTACPNEMIKPTASNISVICVVPVDDTASRSQVLRPQQPPVQGVVLHEGGLAVRRGVYVPVVTDRQQRLQGVLHHAGHCHGNQTVRLVVFKDVAPLAMQEEHNGLQGNREMHSRVIILYPFGLRGFFFLCLFFVSM